MIIPPFDEDNFIFICVVEATALDLFKEGRPKSRLYVEDALTTMYLTVIVLVAFSSNKVVLSSMYPCTSIGRLRSQPISHHKVSTNQRIFSNL